MGLIAKVLQFIAPRNVESDPGGGAVFTGEHFQPAGDDAQPLPGDAVYAGATPQKGRRAALGYVDTLNPAQAGPGEKRIYARDAESGDIVVEVFLRNSGDIQIANASGSFTMAADGSVDINGVTIAANGDVTIPSSLQLNGKELDGHTHGPGTFSNSGGPVVGTSGGNG